MTVSTVLPESTAQVDSNLSQAFVIKVTYAQANNQVRHPLTYLPLQTIPLLVLALALSAITAQQVQASASLVRLARTKTKSNSTNANLAINTSIVEELVSHFPKALALWDTSALVERSILSQTIT